MEAREEFRKGMAEFELSGMTEQEGITLVKELLEELKIWAEGIIFKPVNLIMRCEII